MVSQYLTQYSRAATKFEKSLIVTEVCDIIREGSQNGGFVRKVNGEWMEVGDKIAREKVRKPLLLHYGMQFYLSSYDL